MFGGAGNDTYYIDDVQDSVVERPGEGYDVVYSSVTYSVPANVEKIVLTGSAAISATGTAGDDTLVGNDAANVLTGGDGNDVLIGLGGNDILYGGLGTDVLTGGLGKDTFQGSYAEHAGDTITDFSVGDRIAVTGAEVASLNYTRVGTTLDFQNGASMTVEGANVRIAVSRSPDISSVTYLSALNHWTGLNDFTGDGHSDILWRNVSGSLSTWTVAGNIAATNVRQGAYNGFVDTSWKVVETLDFDGDGRSDVLYRQAGGAVAVWGSTGASFSSATYYRPQAVPTDWRIAGAGDLDGDGKDDLLWQNADGSLSSWVSTGTGFKEAAYTHASPGRDWLVEGLGDFNGDGRADILWRNTDGSVATWTNRGDGAGFNEAAFFQGGVPTGWHVDGIGDFNGDGRDDILWRNDNGAVSVWRANAAGGFDQGVYNTQVPTAWHIAQVGDFNDDGRADILWQNDDGRVSTWQSNGAAFDQGVYNSAAPAGWSVAGHDFVL